jgi:xylan 1,4-beta-xylosidase
LYYAAHKKNGNLCVGVASADKPEGPYTDHGPLVCEEVGSIDAFPMRDENGKLFLIWKEDANSVNKPTPIWAMEMNEERTKLVGEKKELFRNDAPWEANLVEGVSMIKHGDYFYALYAAAGCCGGTCSYGIGIARSKSLLGPWEKYENNPALSSSSKWICPGHGTPVEKDGRHYFMYHAYNKKSNVFTGREGLLIEYRFTPEGWIEFIPDAKPPSDGPLENSVDNFRGKTLGKEWQWSVFQQPSYRLKWGELYLNAQSPAAAVYLARKTVSGNYTATTTLHTKRSTASPGLAVIGDDNNMISAIYHSDTLRLVQLRDGKEKLLTSKFIGHTKKIGLQVKVENGKDIRFFYSNHRNNFLPLYDTAIDGAYLPPWDRAVRVGIISNGAAGTTAVFDRFELVNLQ